MENNDKLVEEMRRLSWDTLELVSCLASEDCPAAYRRQITEAIAEAVERDRAEAEHAYAKAEDCAEIDAAAVRIDLSKLRFW